MPGDVLQLLASLIGAVLGTSGLLVVWLKGRAEREKVEVESREQRQTTQVEADEARETAMATAVVTMARDSNAAMLDLTQTLVTGTNASLVQLAQNVESLRADSGHQWRYARETIQANSDAFEQVLETVQNLNRRLAVVIDHLVKGESDGSDPVRES